MQANEGAQLQTSKNFSVPVSRLYQAWTTAEDLKSWWRPMDNELVSVTNELTSGGKVEYVFETAENKPAFTINGVYKEVKEAERLVYTWEWHMPEAVINDGLFELQIAFSDRDGGSRIEVTQLNFENEEAIQPHRQGWEQALNNLEQYLSK